MADQVSTIPSANLEQLPDIKEMRIQRDRQIALEFVRRKETRTARSEIANAAGLNIRLVYRAIETHLEWARKEIKKGQAPSTSPDPDQTTPSDAIPVEILHDADGTPQKD